MCPLRVHISYMELGPTLESGRNGPIVPSEPRDTIRLHWKEANEEGGTML